MAKKTSPSTQGSSLGPQSLDMLGSTFSLQFQTYTGKFQRAFGGYLTLFMGIFSGAAFIVIFSQFFETDTPMVTSSLEFGSKIVQENLFHEEIFLPIALVSPEDGFMSQKFDKYFTAKIKMTIFERDPKTGRSGLRISRMVNYVKCSDIQDPEIIAKFKKILPDERFLSRTICPDFRGIKEEFFVKTDPINYSFHEILLHIYPCSLADPTQCASKEQVNEAILIFYRLDKFVVSTDKENPLRVNFDRTDIKLDTFTTKYKYMDVKKNMVIDDTSIYGDPKTKLEYATATQASQDGRTRDSTNLHCTKQQVEYGIYNSFADYLMISYRAVSYMMVVRRTYKKLTTIMGEFGGVLKLVTTTVMIFYSIYSSRKMKGFFMKQLFNISKKNSKDFNDLLEKADLRKKKKKLMEAGDVEIVAKNPGQNRVNFGPMAPKPMRGMKDIMKICVENNMTATDILGKLHFVEVLQKTLFTKDERTLIPLVILKMKEEELEESEESTKEEQERKVSQGPGKIFGKKRVKSSQEEKVGEIGKHNTLQRGEENVYKQAYLRIKSEKNNQTTEEKKEAEQDDSIRKENSKTLKSIREFILENVEGFFEEESKSKNNRILVDQDPAQPSRPPKVDETIQMKVITRQDGETSSPFLKFVMKKNKVTPGHKKSFFSSISTAQFQGRKSEVSPLKISLSRKDWQGSQKRLVGSPIKKKVSLKKSKLFFKLENSEFQKKGKKRAEGVPETKSKPKSTRVSKFWQPRRR